MKRLSNRPGATIVAVLILIVAGACAGPRTSIVKLHQDADAGTGPYGRLLVIGVATGPDHRRLMEDLLTERLAGQDVAATAGYTQLGTSPVLLQEEVDAAAAATHSDAILIAHLVSVSEEAEIVEGRTDVKSECRGGNLIDYFLYDHKEIREPDSVRFAREVIIVTNLYDARTGARIWTIQSTCFEKSAFEAILDQEARAIVQQLRRDRLIHPAAG